MQENRSVIDFSKQMITRISAAVDSVPYKNPESIAIIYNDREKNADVEYSGLEVTFGQHQDLGPQVVHSPGKKKISLEQFQELIKMFEAGNGWYAPQSTQEGPWGIKPGEITLYLETRLKSDLSGAIACLEFVDASYFKGGKPHDDFLAIIRKIGSLYGRNILDVAQYD